jgi:hypothetical protein
MKKLLLVGSLLWITGMFSYTWQIYNETDGDIYVTLVVRAGPDYSRTIKAQESEEIPVGLYCITQIKAHGLNGKVKDQNGKFVDFPGYSPLFNRKGTACGNYKVWLSPEYNFIKISTQ